MANFFNYPQVVMSAYNSPPMEGSGTLSLGTTAGIGGSFTTSHCYERVCGYGQAVSTYNRFYGSYAEGNYIFFASCFMGIQAYPISGGSYVSHLCAYYNTTVHGRFCQMTKGYVGGSYHFASNTYAASSWFAIMSFTSNPSTGAMTSVDTYRIGSNDLSGRTGMYADTTLPLVFMASEEGIAVYCYNSSGVLGHSDYDFSDVWGAVSVYSYIRSGCKIVVMTRHSYGLAVWCMNTSTCTLGNYMCNTFKGNSGNWFSYIEDIWGGCATGCHLSDGGFFIVTNSGQGLGVVCTYDDSGTTKLCLKTCLLIDDICLGDFMRSVSGDDNSIYVSGTCSKVYRFSLNCSTGVLTKLSVICYRNVNYQAEVHLHTREGYNVFVGHHDSAGSYGFSIGKPAPHRSISGLYGGADNTDVALSHYYRGGSYVANNSANTNVPMSGAIDFSDFYSQG